MHRTPADLVLTGGPVLTMDPARSRATTVAVTGDRITAVGHDEVRELIGPRTEVVDLSGRLLVPGFQDAHIHPVTAGLELAQCNLTASRTAADTLAAVRAYADSHPNQEWITGAAGPWRPSTAAARPGTGSTPSSPTAPSSWSTATTTAPGSTPAP